jgi:hypothetical protein
MRRSWLVTLLGLSAACYTYRPVSPPGPEPGATISAGLTQEGSLAVAPLLGPEVAEVSGRVVDTTGDTLRLSLASVTSQRGIPTSWRGEEIPLARGRLAYLGERRLSPGGTALLSASVAGGLYLLYRLIGGPGWFEGSGGSGGGGTR